MKRLKLLGIMFIPLVALGFTRKAPVPAEGIYPLKAKTLTYFDLRGQDYGINSNVAELFDSKPDNLRIDFDWGKMADYRFGSFKLGNTNQRTWFVMGKDDQGYWSEFYIDQNNDLVIAEKEKIKSFQSGRDRVRGFDRRQSLTLIPVSIKVSYKSLSGRVEKNSYFFITTTVFSKNDRVSEVIVEVITASFFDGELQVTSGNVEKKVGFRLIDANGNGCFNDYGTDLIFMDLNEDYFYHSSESQKLVEFFESPAFAGQQTQMRRIIIPPYPAKLAVIQADQDFDVATLEAASEPEAPAEVKPGKPDPRIEAAAS